MLSNCLQQVRNFDLSSKNSRTHYIIEAEIPANHNRLGWNIIGLFNLLVLVSTIATRTAHRALQGGVNPHRPPQ